MSLRDFRSFRDKQEVNHPPGWEGNNTGNVGLSYGDPGRWPGSASLQMWNNGIYKYNVTAPTGTIPPEGWGMILGFAVQAAPNRGLAAFYNNNIPQVWLKTNASGFIEARRGDENGVLLATSTNPPLTFTAWRFVEIKVFIHDTNGRVVVRIDGVVVLDFTGDTAATNGATTVTQCGPYSHYGSTKISDLYVADTVGNEPTDFLGDVRVDQLKPVATGAYTEFVGSDGNSLDNYQLVDEEGVDVADYVSASGHQEKDSYLVEDLPFTADKVVHAVKSVAYGFKTDAGNVGLRTFLRDNGLILMGSKVTLSTTPLPLTSEPRTRTAADNPWTIADVNALEVGVEVDTL